MRDKIYINGKEIECELQYNLLRECWYHPNFGTMDEFYVFYVDVLRVSTAGFRCLMDIVNNNYQPVEFKNEFINCNAYITNNGCNVSKDCVFFDKWSPFGDGKSRMTITSLALDEGLVDKLKHNGKIVYHTFYK